MSFKVIQLIGHASIDWDPSHFIKIGEPCILKPEPLYTGKQVVEFLLNNIIPEGRNGITMQKKTRTPGDVWNGVASLCEEGRVIFRQNYFCTGNRCCFFLIFVLSQHSIFGNFFFSIVQT